MAHLYVIAFALAAVAFALTARFKWFVRVAITATVFFVSGIAISIWIFGLVGDK